ncbi:hypothetical protein WDJ51_12425 [Rathayibacter sp. YIM 133350]|uniref:hypothetical protein n=1 Tax=Rathayibacter sp. YIM 133350 TaxID=3131992 RepID=UPI00307E7A1D
MIALSWLLLFAIIGGVLALIDGILRVRGRGTSIIGVIEIIASALFLLALFLPGIPFGAVTLGIITLIVLVIALVLGRARSALSIAAIILLAVWLILTLGWLHIPGIN